MRAKNKATWAEIMGEALDLADDALSQIWALEHQGNADDQQTGSDHLSLDTRQADSVQDEINASGLRKCARGEGQSCTSSCDLCAVFLGNVEGFHGVSFRETC